MGSHESRVGIYLVSDSDHPFLQGYEFAEVGKHVGEEIQSIFEHFELPRHVIQIASIVVAVCGLVGSNSSVPVMFTQSCLADRLISLTSSGIQDHPQKIYQTLLR